MNFLEFVNKKKQEIADNERFNESFNEKDVDKAMHLIAKLLNNHLGKSVATIHYCSDFDIIIDKKPMLAMRFLVNFNSGKKLESFDINFLRAGSSQNAYSIAYYNAEDTKKIWWGEDKAKATVVLNTLGTSVAYFVPVIERWIAEGPTSCTSDSAVDKEVKKIFSNDVKESVFWVGAAKYKMFEGLNKEIADDIYFKTIGWVQEAADDELRKYRSVKKGERDDAWRKWREDPSNKANKEAYQKIEAEYHEILNAIRGGKTSVSDLKFSIDRNVTVEYAESDDEKKVAEEFKKQKEDPEVTFKKMQVYVKSVINGLQPGVILCGAPGIGKTYRVKQQLKANKYQEGQNLLTIKGTCSPRQLYIDMFNYRDKNNIILIDDADALVGAKAPEVAINILKAVLDSNEDPEGRLVTYSVAQDLRSADGEIIPKRMYVKCGVIVITNYSVGELDTALKGRVFTQTLDFDTDQVLSIIKNLIPKIQPDKLSTANKMKAYEYLVKLSEQKTKMEISIRSFASAARLFQLCEDEDLTQDQVEEMIKEQMTNQALRSKDTKHF
jgi:SpoVK/Ycf46/Vps4 family AAA+-type ATPase